MTIKIGGVPEHFNYPWHYALENGLFASEGIEMEWTDFPGGTGAMSSALQNNELDMAILLTEGAIKEISNGAHFKIVKTFVQSPLVWGIHTSSANKTANLKELEKMKFAISRIGSGSHLMSFVYANEQGKSIAEEQMVVVNDLTGALDSLREQQTDLFFWEKFTTKPYVDKAELVRLGEFPTPWPCFVIVAHDQLLSSKGDVLYKIVSILNKSIQTILSDKETTKTTISRRYKLQENDVEEWQSRTKWSTEVSVSETMLRDTQSALESLGLAKKTLTSYLVYDPKILN